MLKLRPIVIFPTYHLSINGNPKIGLNAPLKDGCGDAQAPDWKSQRRPLLRRRSEPPQHATDNPTVSGISGIRLRKDSSRDKSKCLKMNDFCVAEKLLRSPVTRTTGRPK